MLRPLSSADMFGQRALRRSVALDGWIMMGQALAADSRRGATVWRIAGRRIKQRFRDPKQLVGAGAPQGSARSIVHEPAAQVQAKLLVAPSSPRRFGRDITNEMASDKLVGEL